MKTIMKITFEGSRIKATLVFYLLVALATGFVLIFANDLLAQVLNDHLLVQNFDGFALLLFATVGLFSLIFALHIFGSYLRAEFQYNTLSRLSEYYISRLLRAKNSFFTSRSSAELFTRLNESTYAVSFLLVMVLGIISYSTVLVFYAIIIFRIDVFAGIFTILLLPLYLLATKKAGDKLTKLLYENLAASAELSTVTQESFENVSNVKTKTAFSFFASRSAKELGKIKRASVKQITIEGYVFGIVALLRIVAPLLIILAAMQLSSNFNATAANIMLLYINIPLLLGNFEMLNVFFIEYKAAKPFISQLQEFDDVELESEEGVEITNFESLRTDGVKVSFEGGREICVPNFELKNGEKIMFFGESGIGKSTIFNIIMGLNTEYEGDVFVNGINLREISISSLRRVFGITFQNTNALTLDLRGNILLGTQLADGELKKLIKLTSLESQDDTKGDAVLNNKVLSGGEKSRLGLSQTLVQKPEIILQDEVFSNMDEALETKILGELFREYPNLSVICISHRNSSRPFFDRVVDFNV